MLNIKRKNQTVFIALLSSEIQNKIRVELTRVINHTQLSNQTIEECIEDGMKSRVCDLEDIIEIEYYE